MIKKLLWGFAAVAAGLTACGDSDSDGYSESHAVRILPRITRVTGLHFDTNDQIGLTITRAGSDYAVNRMMTYTGSCFETSDLFWYEDATEVSTLTAYYPYSSSGVPVEFSVSSDQRDGCAPSSLLAAVASNVKPGSAPVGMTFSRLFSSVLISVENKSGSPVEKVIVSGTIPTALVDIAAKSVRVKADAVAADITACALTAETSYEAVLVPQTVAMTVVFHLQNGKTMTKTLAAAKLESGMQYTLSVVVTTEKIEVVLSGEVENWGDGGELGGPDNPGGSEGDEGFENGILTYKGQQYRTVEIAGRIWMAENLCYIPDNSLIGAGIWYPAKDGAPCSDPAYVKEKGVFYNFSTATGDVSAVSGRSAVQGVCPPGWQLPDDVLLESLVTDKSYDYSSFASHVGFWNSALNQYGPITKSYLGGAGETGEGKRSGLLFQDGLSQPSVVTILPANGVLIRCVKAQ